MAELLRIETDRLLLVWGTRHNEEPAPLSATSPPGHFILRPRRDGLRFGAQNGRLDDSNRNLRLFEQTDYTLFIRSLTDAPITIEHRDPVLLRDLESADRGRIIHGRINFGSQVGRSTFTLLVGSEPELDFEFEVFPTKLDYAEDYTRLVADTQEILTGLVLEYLRSTFQLGYGAPAPRPAPLEWLMLLQRAGDDLERALDQIARHPRWGLTREPRQTRAERTKRSDAALRRDVLRGVGAGRSIRLSGGPVVRERLQERRAHPTLDTPEHRWLAARLDQIRRRLAWLRREEANRPPSGRRARTLEEIDALEIRIVRLSRIEPLASATEDPPPGFASLQLLSFPGYGEAYRTLQLLSLGLYLEGGPVRLTVKDLHLLYEQWCFLTLVRLVAEEIGQPLPARELLTAEEHGLRVLLQRGRKHAVTFEVSDGGRIVLTYNPRFGEEPLLVPQQPDILLEIHHPRQLPVRLVLDAKYRIDASPEYVRRYGSPGPPEDALNGLHRYRDAIVDLNLSADGHGMPRRTVTRAVALFPYRETAPGAFRASRLWGSIERIEVGAIPLLPGSTEYLVEWVRGVILNS